MSIVDKFIKRKSLNKNAITMSPTLTKKREEFGGVEWQQQMVSSILFKINNGIPLSSYDKNFIVVQGMHNKEMLENFLRSI